ncbi:MAG: carotenoid biosynthesis protein [Desulfarculaceae bacterium]|nr:carotenoid biosynthesis protein [Desulfarculaceae bacterium]
MTSTAKKSSGLIIAGWLILAAFILLRCLTGGSQAELVVKLGPFLFLALLVGFALLHGIALYGGKNFAVFLAIAFVVSWLYENCSIITGFPFGHYYYTAVLGPKLWHVPVFIMGAYAAVGYLAWTLAQVLLGNYQSPLQGKNLFFAPLVASFVMVLWDVCLDPVKATIAKQWIWEQGGPYFGIPLTNYAGWFLCVYTIFQLFAWYMRGKNTPSRHDLFGQRSFWLLPGFMYGTILLELPFLALTRPNKTVTSMDHQQWWTADIYGSMTLIWVFTMIFVTVLSTFKIMDQVKDATASRN